MPTVIETAAALQRQLAGREAAAMKKVIDYYEASYNSLQGDIRALENRLTIKGKLTRAELERLTEYKRLIANVEERISDFDAAFRAEIRANAALGISMGSTDAVRMIELSAGGLLTKAQITRLEPAQIEQLIGFLDPGGELWKRINGYPGATADRVSEAIIDGVIRGLNPRTIASAITDALGMTLTDSLRTVRTVQLWSYREASRASYVANQDVVQGWIWYAELDSDTCASCIAMHGTTHGLDEPLDDHHNGRCVAIPWLVGEENPITQTGEQWLKEQPEAVQKETLGPGRYEKWQEGTPFDKFSNQRADDVYGTMRTETALKDL